MSFSPSSCFIYYRSSLNGKFKVIIVNNLPFRFRNLIYWTTLHISHVFRAAAVSHLCEGLGSVLPDVTLL